MNGDPSACACAIIEPVTQTVSAKQYQSRSSFFSPLKPRVATGLCTAAIGSHSFGLIRIPASYRGVWMLQP